MRDEGLFNLSVASGDSSPFRGAFRKPRTAIGAVQTRRRSPVGADTIRPPNSRRALPRGRRAG